MKIKIRSASRDDLPGIRKLFLETIISVNLLDYTHEQVAVWASASYDDVKWMNKFHEEYFVVAEFFSLIVGFASITRLGHLDFMYVHKEFLRRGIATSLLMEIERYVRKEGITTITSDVSLTARPFFEKNGFSVVTKQLVEVKGVRLSNYRMIKNLDAC